MDHASVLRLLASTVQLSTLLLLACPGGLWSDRAWTFDIGLEGKMLTAAMILAKWRPVAALWACLLFAVFQALALRSDIPPGDLMVLSDHINYNDRNTLISEPTDARFVSMTNAHSLRLRQALTQATDAESIPPGEGICCWYSGRSFETPAEIRMPKLLEGDAVGMPTLPEVILTRLLCLAVTAISTNSNMAAGLSDEAISRGHT